MTRTKRVGTIGLAAVCALSGAAFGISQSVANSSSSHAAHALRHSGNAGAMGAPGGPGGGGPGGGQGATVHSVSEVLNKAGTAYISQTTDSGKITAIDTSAGTITLEEGTSSVTYAKPTITVPSGATVTLDGKSSALSALAVGDEATVSSSSAGTTVFATDSSFKGAGMGSGKGGPPPSGGSTPGGSTPEA